MQEIEEFLKEHRIDEVECLVPDMAGIARGKILPAQRFLQAMKGNGLRLPEAVFVQTVTGDYPEEGIVTSEAMPDIYLVPDPSTIRLVLGTTSRRHRSFATLSTSTTSRWKYLRAPCSSGYLRYTRSADGCLTWRLNWNSSWSM